MLYPVFGSRMTVHGDRDQLNVAGGTSIVAPTIAVIIMSVGK